MQFATMGRSVKPSTGQTWKKKITKNLKPSWRFIFLQGNYPQNTQSRTKWYRA